MRSPNDKKFANFRERWEWLITFMVVEDRFVHQVLMAMEKHQDDSIGTMGISVDGHRISLAYCSKFVDSLSDAELRFVITHEIYHVVLHHCTTRKATDKKLRRITNIAHDLAINCLIPQDKNRTIPVDANGKHIGVLPSDYGFTNKLSAEQYLILLKQKKEEDKKKKEQDKDKNKGKGMGDGDGDDGDDDDDDDDDGDGDGDDGDVGALDNHSGWEESDVLKEIIRNVIANISKGDGWGKTPGDVQALIIAAQQSYVPWERHLKHYIGQMVSPTRVKTMKRPDRRFGYPYAGKKRGYTDRKLVAIDASGSISDADLAQFLAEVNRLAEIQPVDLVVFDDGIQLGPVPFNRKHSDFGITGRGGTNFDPVFKLADERHYQSVIMLTDGCAGVPAQPEFVRDVLWVLTGAGDPPVAWGERVRILPKA